MWWSLGRPVSSVGWWPGISLALIRRGFGLGWPGVRLSGLRRWATRVLVTTAGPVPVAPLLDRALPAPSEGPSEQARRAGRFAMDIHARTSNGGRDLARIAAAADSGYNASSLMLGESALCLVLGCEAAASRWRRAHARHRDVNALADIIRTEHAVPRRRALAPRVRAPRGSGRVPAWWSV
jgi:hypothetical protein